MASGPGERVMRLLLGRSRLSICFVTAAVSLGGLSAALLGGCEKEESAMPSPFGRGGTGGLIPASTLDASDERSPDGVTGTEVANDGRGGGNPPLGDAAPEAPPPIPEPPPDGGGGLAWMGVPALVPGMIQASSFDTGGEGVSFHDTDVGNMGAILAAKSNPKGPEAGFRTSEDVDVGSTRAGVDKTDDGTMLSAGQFYIGWTVTGEWVRYTINVKQSAMYTFGGLVATNDEGARVSFTIEDGTTTGSRALPWTRSTSVWHLANNLGGFYITAGLHVLTMRFEVANLNSNVAYVTLTSQ